MLKSVSQHGGICMAFTLIIGAPLTLTQAGHT
jgi:hypothetical protein